MIKEPFVTKNIAINLYAPSIGALSLFKTNITRHRNESETTLVAQHLASGGLVDIIFSNRLNVM